MRQKLPKSFYFKLLFITVFFALTYINFQPVIHAALSDSSLSQSQQVSYILKSILGVKPTDTPASIPNLPSLTVAQPGNSQPALIDEQVKSLPNYRLAAEFADEFNETIDILKLNTLFVQEMNENYSHASSVVLGEHLSSGTKLRAQELAHYHYLGPDTVTGESFRTFFPQLTDHHYRLGENLYELYIAASDIHLKTWSENPAVFSEYLVGVFSQSIDESLYNTYNSQYLFVYAEPTDYQIDNTAYVRLVVVLTLDTQIG